MPRLETKNYLVSSLTQNGLINQNRKGLYRGGEYCFQDFADNGCAYSE